MLLWFQLQTRATKKKPCSFKFLLTIINLKLYFKQRKQGSINLNRAFDNELE